MTIFTQGYEQSTLDAFIARLKERGIERVADVRDLPLSRRKGFSKTPLSDALVRNGIDYLHVKPLGAPKPLRDAVKAGGPWSEYERGYASVLESNESALADLLELGAKGNLCLVCFERDPAVCHRRLVAEALQRKRPRAVKVEHIRY
jgi:uncharacterized protein (DUF488 family)